MRWFMAASTIAWFVAIALFWYMRPSDIVWLTGSLVLGVLYSFLFAWYVTRER